MANQGRNRKKSKGVTKDLQTFLNESPETAPDGYTIITTFNWADCVDDDQADKHRPDYKKDSHGSTKIILPTVPKSIRAPDIDMSKVPTKQPFKAYLGNLPYDVTEDEVTRFFRRLKVKEVHLMRDGRDKGRPRGVGYAEFEDRETLIEALQQNGETLKNRSIRVSLTGENENDRPRRTDDREDRTAGDWRSGPRDDIYRDRDRFSRDITRNGNDYSPYDSDSYRGRPSYDRQRNQDKYDRGYQRNDRGFRDNRYPDRSMGKRDFGSGFERRNTSQSQRYSPPPISSESSTGHRDEERDIPRERPKLMLKPRTKPLDDKDNSVGDSAIFGEARPVDTAAKEREIEKRLQREQEELQSDSSSSKGLSSSSKRPLKQNKPRFTENQRKNN